MFHLETQIRIKENCEKKDEKYFHFLMKLYEEKGFWSCYMKDV